MRSPAIAVVWLAVTVLGVRAAMGQEAPPAPQPPPDPCAAEESITFDARSTEPDLEAIAQLGGLSNWLMAGPGRYLVVAGPDATASQLGPIRAAAAAGYMTSIGVDPGFIQLTTFAALTPRELHVYAGPDTVVVL